MPIDVMRVASDRIILVCFTGDFAIPDLRNAVEQIEQLLDAAEVTTHLIIQVDSVTSYPTNIKQIYESVSKTTNPKMGWLIGCGLHPMMIFALSVITQLTATKIRTFPTLEDGIAFLKQHEFI